MQLQVPEFGEGTFCSWLKLQVPNPVGRLWGARIKTYFFLVYTNWKCGTGVASTKLVFANVMVFRGGHGCVTSPFYKMDLAFCFALFAHAKLPSKWTKRKEGWAP